MSLIRTGAVLAGASCAFIAGCADTNALLPDPVEVLLVVNRTSNTLSIIPVETPGSAVQVGLGGGSPTPLGVSARGQFALVPLGSADAVAVVDLRNAQLLNRVTLPENSGATGSAIVDDSIAYVANPNLNTVSRVNYLEGTTSEVEAGVHPQAVIFTRGRLFVLNGNLDQNLEPVGESWLTVIDPVTNDRSPGTDFIPLTGPGNAGFAALGGDGLLYVLSSGSPSAGEGRLSIVDPVDRIEIASFSGFGLAPGSVASDREARIFVSSLAEGLMEFNTDSNKVVRGAGEGLPIANNTAVVVDSRGRVYAIESGDCGTGQNGVAHVLNEELEEVRTIALGRCSVGAAIAEIPPE
ncbi:MAG: hypothetical protein ACREMX_01675 [Gemmatimonadales bacterium]